MNVNDALAWLSTEDYHAAGYGEALSMAVAALKNSPEVQRATKQRFEMSYAFMEAILSGDMPFIICDNSQGFQKGDFIEFKTINEFHRAVVADPIINKKYIITYVLSGHGLENGKVALGFKEYK